MHSRSNQALLSLGACCLVQRDYAPPVIGAFSRECLQPMHESHLCVLMQFGVKFGLQFGVKFGLWTKSQAVFVDAVCVAHPARQALRPTRERPAIQCNHYIGGCAAGVLSQGDAVCCHMRAPNFAASV